MKLKIFYYVAALPTYKDIVVERFRKLKTSRLLENSEIYLITHANNDMRFIEKSPNVEFVYLNASLQEAEIPALMFMQNQCETAEQPFYCLYIHQKGISFAGTDKQTRVKHWRWLMDYFLIERWRDCIDKLGEGFNIVGCNFTEEPVPHFSGNQYWARSDLITTWPKFTLPSQNNFKSQLSIPNVFYRYDAEFWYGKCPIKPYSMFNSYVDHYHTEFPPELYKTY